ncbi:type II toxin-antitoxin system PemK/MazF family toxin [Crossiella cryophila]|uniref:mRNA interferase n=1 Tax=Crossiella cryophila TaxID=43355 RepID=A0A7W7FY11_9PSEU|nr:type II toxin-antitoxin system PemK/MazF family toxin [Crossiella cryophila]MBB4681605.1 mRNA interferase MazF [Crossiella cryophila]
MVIERGGIHWADLGEAEGSRPAKLRPVLVVQSAPYNVSRLGTVLVAAVSSNTKLALFPGNVYLPRTATGLPKNSVINVTSLVTLNKEDLSEQVGMLPLRLMRDVDAGLRRVLAL